MYLNIIKLGQIAKVYSGFAFKSKDFVDDGWPVIKIKNIRTGFVDFQDDTAYYPKDEIDNVPAKFHINDGDILISLTGSHITQPASVVGRVGLYRYKHLALLNQRAGVVRITSEKIDRLYLYYFLFSPETRYKIASLSKGAASQANISPTEVESIEILLPPLPTQQRIASILSKYDDLIENNTRRIAILEEQAQALYRQWFVEYKFPGHEDVKMVDSGTEFGEIPEGWEVKEISSIVELVGGFSFKSSSYDSKGEYGIVTIKNVTDGKFITECRNYVVSIPKKIKPHQILETGDILLSLTGNVGRVCLVYGENYLLNQRVAKLQAVDSSDRSFAYCLFRSKEIFDKMNMIAKGVAQQNLSPIETQQLEIVIPPSELRQMFGRTASILMDEIINLSLQNMNLKRQRDTLLPKLVSGEILVESE